MKIQKKQKEKIFLTNSYLFSIPKNCSDLKFESVAPGKIGKNIFQGWKKNCSTWKNIYFSTRKDRKS